MHLEHTFRREDVLSDRACCHRGVKLPENHTCGARCADFPDCISIPLDVAIQLTRADEQTEVAARETASRMESLTTMHDAIVSGLSAQVEREAGRLLDPRSTLQSTSGTPMRPRVSPRR